MNKIIAYGTAFILGVGAGWLVQGCHWDVFLTSYIPALATLLAAFYGAKYAFQFQINKEEEDIKRRNIVSANITLFNLSRMANKLVVYQRDIINPERNSPLRFLAIRPTSSLEKEHVKLNVDGLYFLLETDAMNLLGEVMVEEERYRTSMDAINLRSEYHINKIQPLLEKAGFISGNSYSLDQIKNILGPAAYDTLQETTEQMIEHVDRTLISLKSIADKLKVSIKTQHPDSIVISFVLPNQEDDSSLKTLR
jgi:hypothetical protein